MKTVIFMSRHTAENFIPPDNAAIISISTPDVSFPLLHVGWADRMNWHRADDDSPMSQAEIDNIWSFVTRNEDKELFVHCDAGISRSCAVACFIGALLDRDVKGLDCDSVQFANAVIKASLMHNLWEKQFKEDHIERLCFKK